MKEGSQPDSATIAQTERGLITHDDAKPIASNKVMATDMPALADMQTENDDDVIESPSKANRLENLDLKLAKNDSDSVMQIEDQDIMGKSTNKSRMTGKPMSGKNQDVSSIIDKFDSVDDNDKTI